MPNELTDVTAKISDPVNTVPWHEGCLTCTWLKGGAEEGLISWLTTVCAHFETVHGERIVEQ